jgi:acyl carrier protein
MSQLSDPLPRPTLPVTSAQLRQLIGGIDTRINLKQLKDNTPFRDAGADSFDLFTIILAVQDAYAIVIPDGDIGNVNTLDNMAKYINGKLS